MTGEIDAGRSRVVFPQPDANVTPLALRKLEVAVNGEEGVHGLP